MKRIILLLALPLFLLTHLHAEEVLGWEEETEEKSIFSDYYQFAGVSLSVNKSKFEGLGIKTDAALGIKYGVQSTEWRTMASLEKDHRGFKAATFETDVLFNTFNIESVTIKPYVGASIGYYDHKENDDQNAIFGLHSGLIVNLSNNIDLDLGISHKRKRETDTLVRHNALTLSIHYFF